MDYEYLEDFALSWLQGVVTARDKARRTGVRQQLRRVADPRLPGNPYASMVWLSTDVVAEPCS